MPSLQQLYIDQGKALPAAEQLLERTNSANGVSGRAGAHHSETLEVTNTLAMVYQAPCGSSIRPSRCSETPYVNLTSSWAPNILSL